MNFNAKWHWTFDDYQVLNRAYFSLTPMRRTSRYVWVVLIAIISVWGGVMFVAYQDWTALNIALTYLVLMLIIKFLLPPWAYRRRYKQQQLDGEEITLTTDAEGVHVKTPRAESHLTWQGLHTVSVLEGHTILWQNMILGIAIPDRAFATSDEARRFAEFAKEKVIGQTV